MAAGVACFVKQVGARPVFRTGEPLLRDRKGGDPSGKLKAEIEKWFGSMDNWRADMKARGWS